MLTLRVHELTDCPITEPARMELSALGDFPTSNATGESLPVTVSDAKLSFPVATLALEASAQSEAVDQVFIGYTERVADSLDFVLWPKGSACELFRPADSDSFPGKLGGEALGYASSIGLDHGGRKQRRNKRCDPSVR